MNSKQRKYMKESNFDFLLNMYMRNLYQKIMYDSTLESLHEIYNNEILKETDKIALKNLISSTNTEIKTYEKIEIRKDLQTIKDIFKSNKNIINLKTDYIEIKVSNKETDHIKWNIKTQGREFILKYYKIDSEKINYYNDEISIQFKIKDKKIYFSGINRYGIVGEEIFEEDLNFNEINKFMKSFKKINQMIFKLNNCISELEGKEKENILTVINTDNYYKVLKLLKESNDLNEIKETYKNLMILKEFGNDITNLSKEQLEEIFLITDIDMRNYFSNNIIEENVYKLKKNIKLKLKIK